MRFIVYLLLLFTHGCVEKPAEVKTEKEEIRQPFLLNLQHIMYDGDYNPSFPVWFNDSIIREKGIQKITRRVFAAVKNEDSLSEELKSEFIYRFNKDGSVSGYTINSYYDNILFGAVTFQYSSVKDQNDFILYKKKVNNVIGTSEFTSHISEFLKLEQEERYVIYRERSAGYHLMFMTEKKYWGPLSIDSILQPTVADWVVLGTARYPVKKFQVENKVKLTNVTEYQYEGTAINRIIRDKYPFKESRTISYNDNGICRGFVDSVFTDQKFLSEKVYLFTLEKNGLPLELNQHFSKAPKDKKLLQKETFEYEFYQ